MKLDLLHVTKQFGCQKIVNDVNLSIPSCEAISLIGPSGSGKSTLLRLVAGLEYPTSGKILLDDKEIIFEERALRQYRKKIGILFQALNLFPHLTAMQNISYPLEYVHGLSKEEAEKQSMDLLARFKMEKHAFKKPASLSGGQSQRVALIRAIAFQPKILLLDEPTSALDPLMTVEVLDLITELKQAGVALIIVTHHLHFAEKISNWTIFLQEGKVIEAAPTVSFFKDPQTKEVKNYLSQLLKY